MNEKTFSNDPENLFLTHSFNVYIAENIGLAEAVVFQHLCFWIKHNRREEVNIHEGKSWVKQTINRIHIHCKYLSEDQIRRALKKLVERGFIEKKVFNQSAFDKGLSYTLTGQFFQFSKNLYEPANSPHRTRESAACIYKDNIESKDIEYKENTSKEVQKKVPTASAKRASGQEKVFVKENVSLTKKQIESLHKAHGDEYLVLVEKLSDYKLETGKEYSSDYLAIKRWVEEWKKNLEASQEAAARRTQKSLEAYRELYSILERSPEIRSNLKKNSAEAYDELLGKRCLFSNPRFAEYVGSWYGLEWE